MPTMRHSTFLNLLVALTWIAGIAACVCREKLSEGAGASEDDK